MSENVDTGASWCRVLLAWRRHHAPLFEKDVSHYVTAQDLCLLRVPVLVPIFDEQLRPRRNILQRNHGQQRKSARRTSERWRVHASTMTICDLCYASVGCDPRQTSSMNSMFARSAVSSPFASLRRRASPLCRGQVRQELPLN